MSTALDVRPDHAGVVGVAWNWRRTRVRFVYLRAPAAVLEARLRAGRGHFAGPSLLASQLAALEEPVEAVTVDAAETPEKIVASIERQLAMLQGV